MAKIQTVLQYSGESVMPDLSGLLEKVTAAKGRDKALARAIQCTLGGWHRVEPRYTRSKSGAYIAPDEWLGSTLDGAPILDSLHGTTMYKDVPDCTSSIDAAAALIQVMLPGWDWGRDISGYMFLFETDWPESSQGPRMSSGVNPHPALGLVEAAIRAKRGETE